MKSAAPVLHVTESGDRRSDVPPAILLHGFTGSSRAWGAFPLEGLGSGRRILAVDLPGHGRSPIPTGGIRSVVEQLASVLDRYEVDIADWIGYSMGGRIALAAAVLQPQRVRNLVLESASPGVGSEEDRARRRTDDEELASKLETRGIDWFVEHWMALPLFESQRSLPRGQVARARASRLAQDPAGLAAALRCFGTGSQPSFWEDLSGLEGSTLLLTGSLDEKYVRIAERMKAAMPRATHVSVDGVGHHVHLEAPDRWIALVARFLDEE